MPLIHLGSDEAWEVIHKKYPDHYIFVDFYADWCGPCRVVGPKFEALSKTYEGRALFVKVDVDAAQGVAGQYGIRSIPTFMVFKGGKEMKKVVGADIGSVEAYAKSVL